MKFIITESKLEQIIFKYLDKEEFVKIEGVEDVYFANSSDDEYGIIRYDKTNGRCAIYNDLIEEISYLFSLEDGESKKVIGKWVEDTLKMKVSDTKCNTIFRKFRMRIPRLSPTNFR